MADAPDSTSKSAGSTIGTPLAALQFALALQSLRNTNDPIARARILTSLAQAAAANLPATAGTALPGALGGAGLGLGLAQIARGPGTTREKAVSGVNLGAKTGAAVAFPAAAPFIAAQGIAEFLGNELQRSGSPQLRATGRGLTTAVSPSGTRGFEALLSGRANPSEALKASGGPGGLITGFLDPVSSSLMSALGLNLFNKPPTKGVQFRGHANQILKQLGFGDAGKDFFADKGIRREGAAAGPLPASKRAFDINPEFFGQLQRESPEAVRIARQIGDAVASASPVTRKRGDKSAFAIQVQNILLNSFGSGLTDRVRGLVQQQLQRAGVRAPTGRSMGPLDQALAFQANRG